MNLRVLLAFLALAAGLAGCATERFDIGTAERAVTPIEASGNITLVGGRTLAWGGAIVATRNLPDRTEIEVLAYPLDDRNRPKPDASPVGRFIAVRDGYLESANYAAGRLITVVGEARETRAGKIGEASYVYPVVEAKLVHLWPKRPERSGEPSIHFGVGIGITR